MSNRVSRRELLRLGAAAAAGTTLLGPGAGLLGSPLASALAATTTLKYTNRWGKNNDTHAAGMDYLFSSFEKKQPGIKVEEVVLPVGADVAKNLADCQAGGCPDLMNDVTGTFWRNGYLLDFSPYLKADPKWKKGFDQKGLAFTNTNGHQWGLCNELSPLNCVWNMKVLDKAGVTSIPTTWADLLAVFGKVKAAGMQPVSWGGLYGGGHIFHNLVLGQPGGFAALASNNFNAPQILEALKALKVMVDNKWIAPNEVEQTQQDGQAGLQNDQTAMYMNGIWTLKNDLTAKGLSPDLQKHVKFSGLPALKGGGLVVENRVATVFGISANVKKDPAKLKAAIAFSKYFFSEPVAQKWVGLTWSAMGVSVPQRGTASLAPLPKAFLAAASKAPKKMVLPATPAMQDQLWGDANTALQTLIQGKSAEEAQAAYVTFLAKYKKA